MGTISLILNAKDITLNKSLTKAILVGSFIIMTALGAYVRIPIPFSPVPITLQTFFVILCGAMLGRKLGSLAQASYVGLGVLGMPIFQGYGAGFLHLAGPTGGYLVGFIAASFVVGAIVDRKRDSANLSYILFAMSMGILVIFACGITWLAVGYRAGFTKAVSMGFIPFIPGTAAKLITAAWIYSKIKSRKIFS
ncbi:MAG: biotin transporter BioY [Candidatus Omnitrophica bacterium]|nr:biotin transporter BioY [Candidatus Omnitrophota bacterium]